MDPDTGPLPLPPLALISSERVAMPRLPWTQRLRHMVVQYLPVLLMAVIALATGWLVRQTPAGDAEPDAAVPATQPDYEMRGFSVQHYTADGPAQGVIEGDVVRHFPATDQLHIDGVRLRWTDAAGRTLHASAARAVAEGDGSRVRLEGGAHVVRDPTTEEGQPFEFSGEVLVFDTRAGRLHSDQPVTLRQGDSVFQADALAYDHPERLVELTGHVRGSLMSGGGVVRAASGPQ
jgi:lipopolysaccharide export system protein LptC